jgi:hypothetical protein
VINTSNYTGKDNSSGRAGPTWPSVPATSAQASRPAAHKPGSLSGGLVTVVQVLLSWLAGFPRRVGDRLFTMNDAEAYWRDWQTIRIHGGLGRRYRDPRFDALAECSQCSGTGRGAGVIAAVPCLPCAGTGRIIRQEVS